MTDGDDSPELTMDVALDLLSNSRRRLALYYLDQQSEEVSLNELAAEIAARENEVDVDALTDAQRKRTHVSLYQTHLPKLAEFGIINFDRDRSTVELTDRANELAAYLPDDRSKHPWPYYYLAFSIVSAVIYGLVVYEIAVFGVIPDGTLGGLVIAGVGLLALVHYVTERRLAENGLSRVVRE